MKPNLVHRKCQRSSEKMKQLSKSQALKPRPAHDKYWFKTLYTYWLCSVDRDEISPPGKTHWYSPFWDAWDLKIGPWVQTQWSAVLTLASPLPMSLTLGVPMALSGQVCHCVFKKKETLQCPNIMLCCESNETFIVQIFSICLKVCKWKIDSGFCCALLLLLRFNN
jgi:hypothetical protein